MPSALTVNTDGRVIVADVMGSRLNIYGADGELIEDWPLGAPKSGLALVLSYDDEVYAQAWGNDEGRPGMHAVGPDGPATELFFPPAIGYEPQTISVGKGLGMIVPLSPDYAWAFAPSGEMIAEWASSSICVMDPELRVRIADIPPDKPAFSSFYPDRAGRVRVARQGPGRPDPGCLDIDNAAPPQLVTTTAAGTYVALGGKPAALSPGDYAGGCWADTFVFDLFDVRTGDFLGTVAAPVAPPHRHPLSNLADRLNISPTDCVHKGEMSEHRISKLEIADHNLVLRCQVGDETAFEELFDRYNGRRRTTLRRFAEHQPGPVFGYWVTVRRLDA